MKKKAVKQQLIEHDGIEICYRFDMGTAGILLSPLFALRSMMGGVTCWRWTGTMSAMPSTLQESWRVMKFCPIPARAKNLTSKR